VLFARLELAPAEDRLKRTVTRFQVGVATAAEREAAQTDVEIARIRLREAEARAAQSAPTAAPRSRRQVMRLPARRTMTGFRFCPGLAGCRSGFTPRFRPAIAA